MEEECLLMRIIGSERGVDLSASLITTSLPANLSKGTKLLKESALANRLLRNLRTLEKVFQLEGSKAEFLASWSHHW